MSVSTAFLKFGAINCEPYGGLGNRLLTIVSLYRIAKLNELGFKVGWAPMPGVLVTSMDHFFDLPFQVYPIQRQSTACDVVPQPDNGRWYLPDEGFSKSSRNAAHIGGRFFHCLWRRQDLEGLNYDKLLSLTLEFRELLRHLICPSFYLKEKIAQYSIPQEFDIGIHVRVALANDFAYGVEYEWPDLDYATLLARIFDTLNDAGSTSAFVASPSRLLVERICKDLSARGLNTYHALDCSNDLNNPFDLYSFLDFHMLTKCRSIFRRAKTTFAAVAGLALADNEYTLSDDYAITKRRPLLLTGSAL